ncbi:hypothetical protein ABZV64_13365 [Streptomyces sp. NPDC004959]|uniref:hypothetical protein n=1 Tax=unclassified Streptomyces TaxID=2593676 RepID=UPI001F3AE10F|nr:hypothetical protein [Streptomyces sp. NRRL F-5630]
MTHEFLNRLGGEEDREPWVRVPHGGLELWDFFAVVAVTKARTLITIGFPPLTDTGKNVETAAEKKSGRARGEGRWLFFRKGDSPEVLVAPSARKSIRSSRGSRRCSAASTAHATARRTPTAPR